MVKPSKTPPEQKQKPKKGKQPEAPAKEARKVEYPDRIVRYFDDMPDGEGALRCDQAKVLLGWETEEEYTERKLKENPGASEKEAKFTDNMLTFMDEFRSEKKPHGNKVMCWNNPINRRFQRDHALSLAQDMLGKRWQYNFENIIIGRTAVVESGQHRLIGLVFAGQIWARESSTHWQQVWAEEPTIETMIAFGASELPEIMQTLDNVAPRSEADVVYTSPIFADITDPGQKHECSKILGAALDFLWKRTGAGSRPGTFAKYRTRTTAMDFVANHAHLVVYVRHMYQENINRSVTKLNMTPGRSAAMMYLMATSASSPQKYVTAEPSCEEQLKFTAEKKAYEFWADLLKPDRANGFGKVVKVLGDLVNPDGTGGGGRSTEKAVVLAKAWHQFLDDAPFSGLEPVLGQDPDGNWKLAENPTFGGIDLGIPDFQMPKAEDEEAIRKADEQKKAALRAAELQAIADRKKAEAKPSNGSASTKGKCKVGPVSLDWDPESNLTPGKGTGNKPSKGVEEEPTAAPKKTPPKPKTRKQIQEENTRKCMEADAAEALRKQHEAAEHNGEDESPEDDIPSDEEAAEILAEEGNEDDDE